MPSAEATALTCHPCVADGRFDDVEKTPRFGCVLASFCPQVGVSSTSLRPSLRRNVQKKPKSAPQYVGVSKCVITATCKILVM